MITFLKRLTFSVIITYGIAWSQSSNISGIVADSSNGNVLIGANVIIEGTSLGMATDNAGKYSISNVAPGNYTIKVTYIGYETINKEITISDQNKYELNFDLKYTTSKVKQLLLQPKQEVKWMLSINNLKQNL